MEIVVNNDPPSKSYDGMLWVRLQTEEATGIWLKPKDKLVLLSEEEWNKMYELRLNKH